MCQKQLAAFGFCSLTTRPCALSPLKPASQLAPCTGVLRIVELPRNLRRPVPNEKKLMTAFLDREADRVKDVTLRQPVRAAALKAAEENKKAQVGRAQAG